MKQETTRDEELFQNNLMHRGYIKDFLKKQSKKIVTLQVKLEKEKYDHEDTTAEFRRLELAIWDALTPQEKVKECLSHYPDIDKMLDVAFRDADATVSEEEVVNSNTHERKANIVINLCGERFSVPKGSFRLDFYEPKESDAMTALRSAISRLETIRETHGKEISLDLDIESYKKALPTIP